jgi:hypothetical protein
VTIEVEDNMQGHRALPAKYSNADTHIMTACLVTLK